MIRFQSLTLARGTKPLFEAADLSLNPGEKIGLVSANGSGKSSLFALLRNELHADGGELDFPAAWRIAHVAQETPALTRSATRLRHRRRHHAEKTGARTGGSRGAPRRASHRRAARRLAGRRRLHRARPRSSGGAGHARPRRPPTGRNRK